jgi:hypothetical protein
VATRIYTQVEQNGPGEMSEDHFSEIDSMLAEELPDFEQDSDISISESTREDMIQLLRYAAEELGKSPTLREFNSLDLDVSADMISNSFGTWNEAKEAAGLEAWQRGTVKNIDETYFKSIDSQEKGYWFGAILATSSLQPQPKGDNYMLNLGRVEDKSYFVTAFAEAINSNYSLSWHDSNKTDKRQIQLMISNPKFSKWLLEAGYPEPGEDTGEFPSVDNSFREEFVRGFLESSGYFSTSGWSIITSNLARAEALQDWFKKYGAKRPTISERHNGDIVVRVANVFDIKAIFESLWPDVLETEPSWKPYPQKILNHLQSEYPYPENLQYLDI